MNRVDAPLVSVVMLTYDHARFVERAIDSVLAQRTTFGIELIISEDCSTDGTREAVLARARQTPDVVRVVLSPQNRNDQEVFLRAHREARGRYLAYLDGDDFWTSTTKLQRQVEFLEAHPELSACFHAVDVVDQDGRWQRTARHDGKPVTTELVLKGAVEIKSCSPLFRMSSVRPLPQWFADCFYTDWPLYLVATASGPMGYLDEPLAAYTSHVGGLWSGADKQVRAQRHIDFLELVLPTTAPSLRRTVRPYLAGAWGELATAHARADQPRAAARALLRSSRLAPLRPRSTWRAGGRPPLLRPLLASVARQVTRSRGAPTARAPDR